MDTETTPEVETATPEFPTEVWWALCDALRNAAAQLTLASTPEIADLYATDEHVTEYGYSALEATHWDLRKRLDALDEMMTDTRYLPPWAVEDVRSALAALTAAHWVIYGLGGAPLDIRPPATKNLPEPPKVAIARAAEIVRQTFSRVCGLRDSYYRADSVASDQEWIDTVEARAEEYGISVERLAKGNGRTHLIERLGDKGKAPRWEEVVQ